MDAFAQKLDRLMQRMTPAQRAVVQQALPNGHSAMQAIMKASCGASEESLAETIAREAAAVLKRPHYTNVFREFVAADANSTGRVLDIGCGGDFPDSMQFLTTISRQIDGADPRTDVLKHPHLQLRWQATFEAADIPAAAYDLAFAYNVIEHIPAARPFFEKLAGVLRPGGTFWALSPNARHPFAWMSRSLELAGLKGVFARRLEGVNPYSAFYRLNSPRRVRKAIRGLGFDDPKFFYVGEPGWAGGYFGRYLAWGPLFYDWLLPRHFPSLQLLIIMQLRRQ